MWFFWIFSESLMSRLPALTDPDFIRLSFAHFEERCHMGGLFFFELSQVLLADGAGSARKTEHQATPIPAPGGSPGAQQEPGRSTESPSKGLLDGKHNSGIQQLLWAPGSFTKAALNWIPSELFPVSWEWRALSCINVIPYSSFQEPCWPAFLYCIPSNREDPDPFDPKQSMGSQAAIFIPTYLGAECKLTEAMPIYSRSIPGPARHQSLPCVLLGWLVCFLFLSS